MSLYTKTAMNLFGEWSVKLIPYFPELKTDLRKSKMKFSLQEYLSVAILTGFILFGVEFPLISYIFALVTQTFLFSEIFSFMISIFLTITIFYFMTDYPKIIVSGKAKKIENALPFASLYLSTIAGSKLSVYKTFEIFAKYSKYGELTDEVNRIISDVKSFGMDINTALERAVDKTPSKKFKEMLWGILSISRSGGDLNSYLKEKSIAFTAEHRRKLYEFSQQLSMFIEIYLTAIILGSVFFVTLTSIMGGISGGGDVLTLQLFLILFFLPIISVIFIVLIKSISPGGEF